MNLTHYTALRLHHITRFLRLCCWQVWTGFLALTCMGSTFSVWLLASELPLAQAHWLMAQREFAQHAPVTMSPFMVFRMHGKNACCIDPWRSARWKHAISCGGWTVPTPCLIHPAATTSLYETEQTRDISRQSAKRATKILGPTSIQRIAQVHPSICNASRTTRSR